MSESISELNHLWSKILDEVQPKINDAHIFAAFLSDSYIFSREGNNVLIAVNSALAASILALKYNDLIQTTAKQICQANVRIRYGAAEELRKKSEPIVEKKPEFFANSTVNKTLTFDSFVVGPNNREAQQAALYVSTTSSRQYNPLFIYANPGLGKTHLLHAIVNHIRDNCPGKKALYCTTDEFMVEFIKFVTGEKEQEKLKNFITSHDVFLIDDIQTISGKTQTELFFFQIFDRMYTAGKQIVITSDKAPSELKGFEERLKSRFSQGLTMNIKVPDASTCVSILKSKIKASPLDINNFDEDVLELIASKFSKNIREIDGALNRLVFYTTSFKPTKHIDMEIALEALQASLDVKEENRRLNEERIIETVADYYSLSPSQLTGKGRPANVVLPRHVCMYLIRSLLDVPFTKIGQEFGGKDHTTVMSGVKKVEKELKTNSLLQTAISDIRKRLK